MNTDKVVLALRSRCNPENPDQLDQEAADLIERLQAHANALEARLIHEYTEGPCVDQSVGSALPQEIYDYRRDFPREGK